jgi:glycerophosphoryl diester phosphodiesterase
MIFDVKPSLVGHRGYGAGAPGGYRENSVESFLAAAASGVSWVELDARRSSDGALVLWHDRVTPDGRLIADLTAADLAATGIIRLEEVLTALPATIGVNIDVKTTMRDATDPHAQRTHALAAEILRLYAGTRPLFVSSFDASLPCYLKNRASLAGDVVLGLITETGFPADHAISAAANLGFDAVCLSTRTLRIGREGEPQAQRILDVAHEAGLEVMAWSPDPAESVELARAGVDALCVNDIPGVRAALAGLGEPVGQCVDGE